MLLAYVSSFQNGLNDLPIPNGWSFMDDNVRVGIADHREMYRKSNIIRKVPFFPIFSHHNTFFELQDDRIDLKSGQCLKLIHI